MTVTQAREPLFLRHVTGLQLEDVRVNGRDLPALPPDTPAGTEKLKIRL
ncbi:MAG: hypothetical protein ACHQ5A_14660 [Opitutales bacterium]